MNRLDVLFLRLGGNEKDIHELEVPEEMIEEEEEEEELAEEPQDFEDVFEELNYVEMA